MIKNRDNEINDELKSLAALALRNAFWNDFSELVNVYLKASEGLGVDEQETLMGELTSVYGRKKSVAGKVIDIKTLGHNETGHHRTILGALKNKNAKELYVNGKKVFEKRNSEWYYNER